MDPVPAPPGTGPSGKLGLSARGCCAALSATVRFRCRPRGRRCRTTSGYASLSILARGNEAVLYIATHTSPGATVFDGFAGSGTTGLAALLCGDPPEQLRKQAAKLGLRPHWGPTNAVLYEISGLGAFVANTLNNPPCPERFRDGAEHVLQDVTDELGWMYAAEDPDGGQGCFRHVVWSDVVLCPNCGHQATLWDACVSFAPAGIAPLFHCPHCGSEHPVGALGRVTEQSHDDLTGDIAQLRHRTMGRIYGATGRSTWSRSPTADDLGLLARIASHPIPTCVPKLRIPQCN